MHFLGTVIAVFGIMKYALDLVLIKSIRGFQETIRESLRHSGKLSESGQQSLILDVVDRGRHIGQKCYPVEPTSR